MVSYFIITVAEEVVHIRNAITEWEVVDLTEDAFLENHAENSVKRVLMGGQALNNIDYFGCCCYYSRVVGKSLEGISSWHCYSLAGAFIRIKHNPCAPIQHSSREWVASYAWAIVKCCPECGDFCSVSYRAPTSWASLHNHCLKWKRQRFTGQSPKGSIYHESARLCPSYRSH